MKAIKSITKTSTNQQRRFNHHLPTKTKKSRLFYQKVSSIMQTLLRSRLKSYSAILTRSSKVNCIQSAKVNRSDVRWQKGESVIISCSTTVPSLSRTLTSSTLVSKSILLSCPKRLTCCQLSDWQVWDEVRVGSNTSSNTEITVSTILRLASWSLKAYSFRHVKSQKCCGKMVDR